MEATMFTGWIYDHLKPHAAALKVAHPLMLRAIAAAKKKNDRIDARKICDCLRCDFLPECYMASTAIRERRRTLRYRNLLVRQMVQMKIKISALLMEAGISYNKQKLHKAPTSRTDEACVKQSSYLPRALRLALNLSGEIDFNRRIHGHSGSDQARREEAGKAAREAKSPIEWRNR
jgi:transposase